MRPSRAAWLFAAGLSWLVLRGILAEAVPALEPATVAVRGGWLLLIPAISLAASLTAPLFFASFLRFHDFGPQSAFRLTTVLVLVASVLGFAMVLVSFLAVVWRQMPVTFGSSSAPSWMMTVVPLAFVVSLLAFMVAFWRQRWSDPRLGPAAAVGALGALISSVLVLSWVVHTRSAAGLSWYPDFSQSLSAKLLGLAAAGALLWFLETFAVAYDDVRSAGDSV